MRVVTIGTRGSELALRQVEWLRNAVARRFPEVEICVLVIRTESDRQPDTPITSMDARGVFTRDIELALGHGKIDAAVHSLKDLPSEDVPGLVLAATSPREDPRDVLLTRDGTRLDDLSPDAVVGTSSLRRCALLREARPDLRVRPIRGNVDTRLRRLQSGQYDAIVMAAAAINRLEIRAAGQILDPPTWVPAVAQGIIGVQARADDEELLSMLSAVSDTESMSCARVERAFLRSLEGGCSVPVGGLSARRGDSVSLTGFVGSPDGERVVRLTRSAMVKVGDDQAAETLGRVVARELLSQGGDRILEELRERMPLLREG